jgi:N-acetylglucosaminyl-diphospho-decaprenol L-rhamnosyltransferase
VSLPRRVSAVVVHYRAEEYLARCLDALVASRDRIALDVVVVDNGSITDQDRWKRAFPHVRWVFAASNRGFSAAVNDGARLSRGDYLLVFNPDAWPLDGCVENLVVFLESTPQAALVSPQLVSPAGVPQPAGGKAPTLWRLISGKVVRALGIEDGSLSPSNAGAIELEWASATALLCRRRAWEEVGGLDDGFFLYYEDCDLGLRLRRRGWRLYMLPTARAAHVGGASFREDPDSQLRAYRAGQDRYFRKHRSPLERRLLSLLWPIYKRIGLRNRVNARYP